MALGGKLNPHSFGAFTSGPSTHTVKQCRVLNAGATRCSILSDKNATNRPSLGATRVGVAQNGTRSSSPPSPVRQWGFRYRMQVSARLDGGPGLS